MVHFVSTQPGRETMNRVSRSCWQQRLSVRVPLLVPTASPLAASYAVFLSVRTRALRLFLSLSLSLSHCDCVSSSSSSPNPHFNPHPSAQRSSHVTYPLIHFSSLPLLLPLLPLPPLPLQSLPRHLHPLLPLPTLQQLQMPRPTRQTLLRQRRHARRMLFFKLCRFER